ncbi:MAG: hypothetical protein WA459_22860 [Stellaceae bacterium]
MGFYYSNVSNGVILNSSFATKNGFEVGASAIVGGYGDTHPNGIYGYNYA